MIENQNQESIWPDRIFIPIPVGNLSSVVHRRMATPESIYSADGPICVTRPLCFECGFLWEVIDSVYGMIPMHCPNCSASTGISITDIQKFGQFNH